MLNQLHFSVDVTQSPARTGSCVPVLRIRRKLAHLNVINLHFLTPKKAQPLNAHTPRVLPRSRGCFKLLYASHWRLHHIIVRVVGAGVAVTINISWRQRLPRSVRLL